MWKAWNEGCDSVGFRVCMMLREMRGAGLRYKENRHSVQLRLVHLNGNIPPFRPKTIFQQINVPLPVDW